MNLEKRITKLEEAEVNEVEEVVEITTAEIDVLDANTLPRLMADPKLTVETLIIVSIRKFLGSTSSA